MSSIGSYPVRQFNENQKFLVQDPSTSTASLVLGSDLVNYILPNLNSVLVETTRTAAQNTDYSVGTVVRTTGDTAVADGLGTTYLVVAGGTGDYTMLNGNDLLAIPVPTERRVIPYESLADVIASVDLLVGQRVSTAGYYTPGDGGGNDYEIVAGGTGTADGGSFIDLDNGLQAKGLFLSGVVSVKHFAFNDFDSALDNAAAYVGSIGGGGVYIPGRATAYEKLTKFSFPDRVFLYGDGESTTINIGANVDAFSASGSIATGEANTLASDASFGDLTVTLAAGKGVNFSSGDWALLLSQAADPNNVTSLQNAGELVRVNSVAGDVITFDGPLTYGYLTADAAELQRITMKEFVGIKDLKIFNSDPTNFVQFATEWLFCFRPFIEGVVFENNKNTTAMFQGCVSASVYGCKADNLKSQITTPTGFGYFVAECGPNLGLKMSHCSSIKVRHAYTTLDGKSVAGVTITNGVPTGSEISNCSALFPLAAGFDTHGEGIGIAFVNCVSVNSRREGFQVRATDVQLTNCRAIGATTEGYQFAKSVRAIASSCTAYRTNTGIDPENADDSTILGAFLDQGVDTSLIECSAIQVGGHGFQLTGGQSSTIQNWSSCHAVNVGQVGVSPRGFYVTSAENVDVFCNNCTATDSDGNMVRGFDASSANPRLVASGCYVKNFTNEPFNGNWSKIGSLNGAVDSQGEVFTATLTTDTLDADSVFSSTIKVEGEGSAVDDLSTIAGGLSGDKLFLIRGANQITIKHAIDNIFIEGGADFTLTSAFDFAIAHKVGGNWVVETHNVA